MTWVARNRHWLLFAGVVVTTMVAVGVLTFAAATLLLGALSGGLLAVLDAVAMYFLFGVVLLGLDVLLAVGLLVTLVSKLSLPENERLADAVGRVERTVTPGDETSLADRFEPSVETRRERLRERYVDGELTELEFERRLDDLLAEAPDESTWTGDREYRSRTSRDTVEKAEGQANREERERNTELE